ncbi:MAG: thioester reductase domain-containing protein [bacterium]
MGVIKDRNQKAYRESKEKGRKSDYTTSTDIAIIGMACRFPGAHNYRQFADNLMQGINSVKEIPPSRWDIKKYYSPNFDEPNKSISKWCGLVDGIDKFDNHFFNISPREANNMDPQQRLLLEETWHCIEDSGVSLTLLQEKITSVYVGVMAVDYHQEASAPEVITDSYACLGNYECVLANRISYIFGLQGASISIDAACASSLVAIHEAKRSLIMGESDYSLTSGVSLNFHPWKYISFSKSRMLSPDGQCKTFDINANGYVPGDGVGVLLLQRLEDALKDGNHIYGIIKGSAISHGGKTLSITAPRVDAQKGVILSAYKDAGLTPETVTYVEAHGTGTSLGDPIEIESLTKAFREYTHDTQYCKVGSVKSNIGHLEAAAGIAGVMKVVMMMRHRKIPKSLNIKKLNPIINFKESPFIVATELSEWEARDPALPLRAGVSSFGFGGVNSHLILEEYPEGAMVPNNGATFNQLFLLSAKSSSSIQNLIKQWREFVHSPTFTHNSLNDICTTLKLGRGQFPYRYGAHLHSKDELKEFLNAAAPAIPKQNKKYWCLRIGDFLFDGLTQFQGYLGRFDLFKQHLETIVTCFLKLGGKRAVLHDFYQKSWTEPHKTLYSFMVVYAGSRTLMDLGFKPDVVTGEKAGVLVGLVLCDIMKLEDALAVLGKKKELYEIQFTRPKIPYYDSILKRTIMPFHFSHTYLHLLIDELSRGNKLLGQILVDGILYTQKAKSKTSSNNFLGKLLLRNGIITESQLDDALAEQKKTKDYLGNIIVEKGYCSADDLTESLTQQDILRHYVHETFRYYVDKARMLSESQFTFKKYLQEWDTILKKSGKSLMELLHDDKLLSRKEERLRNEKLLLMIIIMNCLRKLNQKWNLTEPDFVKEKRFYELVDLITDGVMPKEDLVELFLSNKPDYIRIAHTLNTRQAYMNLDNSYRFIKRSNQNIREIRDIPGWLIEQMEIKNILPEDTLAYLPLDDIAFYEFGAFKAPLPVESTVHLKLSGNISELFTDSLLDLWMNGIDIHWEKLSKEGTYNTLSLPLYPFDRKSFWLRPQSPQGTSPLARAHHETHTEQDVHVHRRFSIHDSIILNHVITGKPIVPASSMIEFVLAASQELSKQPVRVLHNILIQAPCVIDEETRVEVTISPHKKRFILQRETTSLCNGEFDSSKTSPPPALDLSCFTHVHSQDIKNLYQSLARIGYQYGKGLQVIADIWEHKTLFVVELKRSSEKESLSTHLDPWILDGVFQAALAYEYCEGRLPEDNTLYVPYFIKSLHMFGPLHNRCFVCLDKTDTEKKGADLKARLRVFDASGQCIVLIQDMLFKRVSDQFLIKPSRMDSSSPPTHAALQKVYYYKPRWVIQQLNTSIPDVSRRAAIILEDDAGRDLSHEIARHYRTVFFVNKGTSCAAHSNGHYTINPEKEQEYEDILQKIAARMEESSSGYDIFHLWADGREILSFSSSLDFNNKHKEGVQSLFFLAKALTKAQNAQEVSIVVNTCNVHIITNDDTGEGYVYGGLGGLAKSIMLENPKIKIKIVDFSHDDTPLTQKARILLDESASPSDENIVAYRGTNRYVRSFDLFLPTKKYRQGVIKDGHVYLLIGGAGGIGAKIAEMIAQAVKATLILIGRSPLNPDKKRLIEHLQMYHSEIAYIQGDVTNQDQMEKIIQQIRGRYGYINGVIHTGGTLDDKLLVRKQWASFQRVAAPKVEGTWIIHQLTQQEPLDFFIVFSSIVSLVGNAGQADYAAANSFLDSFIHYRTKNNYPGRSMSINWTLWADGGMGIDEYTQKNFEKRGLPALSSAQGLDAFTEIIQQEGPCQLAVLGKRFTESKIGKTELSVKKGKVKQGKVKGSDPKKRGVTNKAAIEEWLAALIASKIGSSEGQIKRDESFFSLGVESIIIQDIMSELDKKYDTLPPTLLFEYPNINQLAAYLKDQSPKDGLIMDEERREEEIEETGEEEDHDDDDHTHDDDTRETHDEHPVTQQQGMAPSQRGYEIAVIGMNGRFPMAPDLDTYWRNLIEGRDCIEEIPEDRWDYKRFFDPDPNKSNKSYGKWGGFIRDIDKFDPLFFAISPREAEQMDPQQRLLLECVWATMEHAGYGDRQRYGDRSVGLFVGTMWNEYSLIAHQGGFLNNTYCGPGSIYWAIANRVSYFMDFKGPSISLDTACSSSLIAVDLACQSILRGDCDMAIAGGVNLSIHPSKYIYLSQAKFLSSDGRCRSFGIHGTGYVPGEGIGAVLLKPLHKAIHDRDHIYGVIRGSSTNHGGKATGFTVPNPEAHTRLIIKAFERAHISAEQIDYIECHGTGTSLGDPIEIAGLTKAFHHYMQKRQFCPIGSVKSNIGHLEAAAGVAALIKVLLCMKHNTLPKSLHSETTNPHIQFTTTPFYVVNETMEWKAIPERPLIAGISSFGAGGANAHLIVESYSHAYKKASSKALHLASLDEEPQIIVLSAKNEKQLKEHAQKMIDFLKQTDISLPEIAYTLQVGREAMGERLACIVSTTRELMEKLMHYALGEKEIPDFYQGRVRAYAPKDAAFTTEEEEKKFIERLIKEKKLADIAHHWVAGVTIEWHLLYEKDTPHRCALPTYPFARKRYWIPDTDTITRGAVDELFHQGRYHPLIDPSLSIIEEGKFARHLTGNEFFLEDHQVNKKKIMPGVAIVEMALAAAEMMGDKKIQRLKDIVWLSPICVGTTPRTVYINLSPHTSGVTYKVITNDGKGQPIIHAQGKALYDQGENNQDALSDIDAIKRRCSAVKDGSECYRHFHTLGFQYGPRFQSIKRLWSNETEALSLLEVPAQIKEKFEDFTLHPSLMDGALQTLLGLINESGGDSPLPYLPFSVGKVYLLRPFAKKCFAHVILDNTRHLPTEKRFTIELMDEAGHGVVRMHNVILRALKRQDTTAISYYKGAWERASLTVAPEDIRALDTIILFAPHESVRVALRKSLKRAEDIHIPVVKPGKHYEEFDNFVFTVNPGHKEDYMRVMSALNQKGLLPGTIIHLWASDTFQADEKVLATQLERSVYSVVYLTQALMGHKLTDKVRMLYAFARDKDAPHPAYAAVSGFAKTLSRENTRFIYKILEMDTPLNRMDIIAHEVRFGADDEKEVRYEGDKRLVKGMREFTPFSRGGDTIPQLLKEKGVYVITGGMGGLGLIFARYLAMAVKARLVLTGRSPLNSAKEGQIRNLEHDGSKVLYIQADVSRRDNCERLIAETKAHFHSIDGIIHSAGVIRDAFILKKTREQVEAVIAPKVYGTLFLDDVTKDETLDFFVLFSSITAVMGNAGQCDYAYANSFMDNFAARREVLRRGGKRSGISVSINWPLWKEGGMRVDEQTEQFLAKTMGMKALSTEAGVAAFAQGLQGQECQFVVAEGDREKLRKIMGIKIENTMVQLKETDEMRDKTRGGDLRPRIQKDIIRIVSDILKVSEEDIHLDEDMSAYGFDSVSFTGFASRINDKYTLEITPPIFFEYPSIEAFADYLYTEYRGNFVTYYQSSSHGTDKTREQVMPHNDTGLHTIGETKRSIQETKEKNRGHKDPCERRYEPLAIIGMSGVMPQSENLDVFWKHLEEGKDLITEIPKERWDWTQYKDKTKVKWGGFMKEVDKFDALFFGISPREAELMDPQQRLFLETVWKTIEDAGYKPSDFSGTKTGIFVGVATADYNELLGRKNIAVEAQTSTGRFHSITANRISYLLNLHGPSEPIDTACSSSLVAMHRAVKAIRSGDCDMAIVGGVNVMLTPTLHISFSKAGMLCEDGRCKTFDKQANGYARGEGVGAILIKPLHKAEADGDHIYALIRATAENHGGHATSLTAPNPNAQAELLIHAYEEAGIDPATISYIEAHGTGTSLGDPIEINGLKKAFKELYTKWGKPFPTEPHCGIGTVKTNIGHLETAAGIAGVLKMLLAIQHKKLPATVHFKELNPYVQLEGTPFYIVAKTEEWETLKNIYNQPIPRRAGVSSFGFGGVNAHVVLEEYTQPSARPTIESHSPYIIILSAKNRERLTAYATKLLEFIRTANCSLADMAYTLQVGREAMEERLALVVSDMGELSSRLIEYCKGIAESKHVFTGNTEHNKERKDLLIEGEEGKEFIRVIIQNKNLVKLARLWTAGVDIEWRLLYPSGTPHRISLHSYPFLRERYWIPEGLRETSGEIKTLHPLIDTIVPSLSINEGLVFQKILHASDLLVKDHLIRGRELFPAVAYMEMAREAISQINNNFNLTRMVWLRPLAVREGKKEIHLILKKEDEEHIQFEFQSGTNGHPLVHAKGIAQSSVPSEKIDQSLSIDEIRMRCTRRITKKEVYERFKRAGMNYGLYFQAIQQIWCNEDEALGHCMIPREFEKELTTYSLCPTLMDGALQTIAGFYKDISRPLVPFAVEKVEILHPLTPQGYAYVKALGKGRFHVALLDEAGLVRVKLHEVTMREAKDDFQDFFYVPQWTEKPLLLTLHEKQLSHERERVLIIYPIHSLGLEKAVISAHPEDEIIEIRLGTETGQYAQNCWEINTEDPSALDNLIRHIPGIDTIYFLGGVQDKKFIVETLKALEHTQERGVVSLLRLIQALSRHNHIRESLKLKVITNDAHQLASVHVMNPYASTLFGFTRVMANEYPMMQATCIDVSIMGIEMNGSGHKLLALGNAIRSEPADNNGAEVILHDGKRYTRTLVPKVLSSQGTTAFRHQGVYVILGGAGGIGLEVSRYLAKKVEARLVLLGRSELDDKRREKIKLIEKEGGKVLYIKADATDLASMKQAIDKARSQFGPLNGVIHSALILKDMLLENMEEKSFREALAPKVRGSMALYKAVEGESLDFMMFFSSAVSFMGNKGQSNYTAGCTFKDTYARYLNQRTPYPVKIINWGFWGSVGIAASEKYRKYLTALGAESIEADEGMEAIERVVGNPADQIMVIKAHEDLLEKMGVDLPHQATPSFEGDLSIMASTTPMKPMRESKPSPQDTFDQRVERPAYTMVQKRDITRNNVKHDSKKPTEENLIQYIQKHLVNTIGASVGMNPSAIDLAKSFSDYGVDSIIGLELVNNLNKVFGITLKTTIMFTYANVKDLSRYISEKYGEEIAATRSIGDKKEKMAPKPHRVAAHELFLQTAPEALKKPDLDEYTFHAILLTGPTGILGGYILKELLETTDAHIYCIIRARDIAHAQERLAKILISYNAEKSLLQELQRRVIPLIGDITKKRFGLSKRDYRHLADSIDCTIHIAASTNLVMPYNYLAPINVTGVKNIIDLVLGTRQKYLIHVSSYHVMADVIYRSNFAFKEQDFDVGQKFTKMGYQETKFEGERLVRDASNKGLVWNIIRPGNIFGESGSGLYPLEMSGAASIFHRLFELIIKSGVAAIGNNYFDITPVDYIAKGIISLGLHRKSFFETYHLLNTDKKRWYEIINIVNEYGYKIKLLPVDEYLRMVHENTLPIDEEVAPEWLNLMKYGFATKEFFINDGHADAEYTHALLKDRGIACPPIDLQLLGPYLAYYASNGIIPRLTENNGHKKKPLPTLYGKRIHSRLKERKMEGTHNKSKKYEFIIVGSGAGGATMAKELAKRGKRVIVVEQGKRYKHIGGLFKSFQLFDHHAITMWPKASKEGVFLYRAIMGGGSTAVSCGNGTRCSEEELAAFGIDLTTEYEEAEKEMDIAPYKMRLSSGSKAILKAAGDLGYHFERMPKFMRYERCKRCAACFMGCKYNAKWTSLDYLDEAIENGAEVMYETAVEQVIIRNGKAVGIKGKRGWGRIKIYADVVILAAGGLATPVILQKTGIKKAGTHLFGDLLVNTYDVASDLTQLGEPSMALLDNEFHESKGFILSTWPQPSRSYRFAEAGVRGMLLPPAHTLGIMTKSADDPTGRVFPDGTFSKTVTESDMARLNEGVEISKEILIKAGVNKKSIVVGKPFGAHPGGTAALGRIVNKDLQTEIDNLFVCDASVFPKSLGAPPILAIAAMAKRLAKMLGARRSLHKDNVQQHIPVNNNMKSRDKGTAKIAVSGGVKR